MRKMYGGTMSAVALVPRHIASKIAEGGRIKVDMVYCRVRICIKQIKRYRYLAVRHEARNCRGPNKGKICQKCGTERLLAVRCDAGMEVVIEFRCLLQLEAKLRPRRHSQNGEKQMEEESG